MFVAGLASRDINRMLANLCNPLDDSTVNMPASDTLKSKSSQHAGIMWDRVAGCCNISGGALEWSEVRCMPRHACPDMLRPVHQAKKAHNHSEQSNQESPGRRTQHQRRRQRQLRNGPYASYCTETWFRNKQVANGQTAAAIESLDMWNLFLRYKYIVLAAGSQCQLHSFMFTRLSPKTGNPGAAK